MTDDARYMRLALDACRDGIEKGQTPFGACIVRGGNVLAVTHNHVWLQTDPTAHAEVCAIREACGKAQAVHLDDAVIYSTTEPCPMCFTAVHWARIGRIVYAARVGDARDFGFNELQITNAAMKRVSGSTIGVTADFMRDDALALYRLWQERRGKTY